MGHELKLPSGATLTVNGAPLADAKKLLATCAKEMLPYRLGQVENRLDLYKDVLCIVASSPEIEAALWPCLRRCLYAGAKIDDSTFEGENTRQDYLPTIGEVIKENVFPFMKGLWSQWGMDWVKALIDTPELSDDETTTA